MTATPLLKVEGLHKNFGDVEVLRGIDFDVAKGEKIALLGPSGSGKSTCLRCVNFLEKPTSGRIVLDGAPIGETVDRSGRVKRMSDTKLAPQRRQMGMVFQLFYLWPHLTVRENVAIGPRQVQGLSRAEADALAEEMLDKVQMLHKADEHPERLSGGQQQRVAIARALAQKPKLLLFDEPTSALDPELVGEVLAVIHALADEGRTMLLVTHEIAFAADVADRVIFIDEGVVVEEGPPSEVLADPQEARTRAFLRQLEH